MLDLKSCNVRALDTLSFSAGPSQCFTAALNRPGRKALRTRHVAMARQTNTLEFTKYQGLGNDFILVCVEQLPQDCCPYFNAFEFTDLFEEQHVVPLTYAKYKQGSCLHIAVGG